MRAMHACPTCRCVGVTSNSARSSKGGTADPNTVAYRRHTIALSRLHPRRTGGWKEQNSSREVAVSGRLGRGHAAGAGAEQRRAAWSPRHEPCSASAPARRLLACAARPPPSTPPPCSAPCAAATARRAAHSERCAWLRRSGALEAAAVPTSARLRPACLLPGAACALSPRRRPGA